MRKYSILLVDDHRILLEGIKNLLSELPEYEISGTASSAEEAVTLLKEKDYDILVTDFEMPGLGGAELVKIARTVQPDIKIIVLSMHQDPAVIRELLRNGVNGYVLKQDTHKSLVDALYKVVENKRFLSDAIAEMLIHVAQEQHVLTPREIEIVKLIAKEFSTRQIAEILFISERTVETHRKNILRKTGAINLAGLMKFAYENKLIS